MREPALKDVKPGDKLIAFFGYSGVQIVTVDRVTKTQAICGMYRFRLEDGYVPGGSRYHRPYARFATADDIEAIKARSLRAEIHDMTRPERSWKWHASALESILATLKSAAIERPKEEVSGS